MKAARKANRAGQKRAGSPLHPGAKNAGPPDLRAGGPHSPGLSGSAPGGAEAAKVAGLSIRPALPGDAVPLGFFFDTALRKDYFLRRGQLEDMLRGPHHRIFVAEIDAVLVGVAIMTAGTRLVNVLIHPGYRGLNIGRALVEASGATQVRAKLDMSTGDPRGFYEQLGFHGTGQRNEKNNIELMQRAARGAARKPLGRARLRGVGNKSSTQRRIP